MNNPASIVTDTSTSPRVNRGEVRCDHCGLMHSPIRQWEGRAFCCSGCEGAYRLIRGLGFEKFYELRDRDGALPTMRPGGASVDSFSALDDPRVLSQFGRRVGPHIAVEALLEGVNCAACIWLLERLPEIHSGVITSRLDYGNSILRFVFDPAVTKLSAVASVLSMLGYRPRMLSSENRSTETSRVRRLAALRIGVAGFSSLNAMMMAVSLYQGDFTGIEDHYRHFLGWASLIVSVPAMVFSASPILAGAWSSIRARKIHVDFPLAIAIVGGFFGSAINVVLGNPEIYFDSVTALIFLLLVSRWFQQEMIRRVTSSSVFVPSLESQIVRRVLREVTAPTHLSLIQIGDTLSIEGEGVVPVDGVLTEGGGYVDLSSLTGETVSRQVGKGDRVFAGSGWRTGSAQLCVEAIGEETRIGKVVVSGRARDGGAHLRLLDRVGSLFVFAVLGGVGAAVLLHWGDWVGSAEAVLSLLIVSCPCAIAIGAPLAFARALGNASAEGILIKGVQTLERLTGVTKVFVDKTGTLTSGNHAVVEVLAWDAGGASWRTISREERRRVVRVVEGLEQPSSHPVGRALFRWASSEREGTLNVQDVVVSSQGVSGSVEGVTWWIGSEGFVSTFSSRFAQAKGALLISNLPPGNSLVCVGNSTGALFGITLGDSIRNNARRGIEELSEMNLSVEILSGDRQDVVDAVAHQLGVSSAFAHGALLPEEKLARVSAASLSAIMVGDGVNDAPSLRAAGVGVAVSGGAEVSLREADVYCAKSGFSDLPRLIRGARRTFNRLNLSLAVSLFYNSVAGVLSVCGFISPLLAALIMPVSSLTAILIVIWGRGDFSEERR